MPDWAVEERIQRMADYARSHGVAETSVFSIKLRFLSTRQRENGQVYLGSAEYSLIDEAFLNAGWIVDDQGPSQPNRYLRHETGPEVLSLLLDLSNVADIIGVVGGVVTAWNYIRGKLKRTKKESPYAFHNAKYLSIEIRALDQSGGLLDKQVAITALSEGLNEKTLLESIRKQLARKQN
jgi:hypothetical protein